MRVIIIAIVAALLLAFTACDNTQDMPDSADMGQTSEFVQDPAEQTPGQEPDAHITDRGQLAALWERYLLPGVLELENFEDTKSLTSYQMGRVAFRQFTLDNDIDTLQRVTELEDEYHNVYLWPLDTAAIWIDKVFGYLPNDPKQFFSQTEGNNYYGPTYSPDYDALLFRTDAGSEWGIHEKFGLDEQNPWGFGLGEVTKRQDGIISAQVLSYDSYQNMFINCLYTFILGQRRDGDYYFISKSGEWINNNRAALGGNYKPLNCLSDELGGLAAGVRIVGEDNGHFFISFEENTGPEWNSPERAVHIWKIDPALDTVTEKLRVELDMYIIGNVLLNIRDAGDGFLLLGKQKVYKYGYDFRLIAVYDVPLTIQEKMRAEISENGRFATVFFSGYDMSADGSMFYYSNQDGLWSYSVAGDSHTMLIAPQYGSGRLMEGATIVPAYLRLVDNDTKITFTVFGYEGIATQNCLNLKTLENQEMPSMYYGNMTGYYHGFGHMAIIFDVYANTSTIYYYDYASGQLKTAPSPSESGKDIDLISMMLPVGKSHGLFGARVEGQEQRILYRVRFSDMEVVEMDLSISYDFTALGVLSDGSAVIYYLVNEAEQGAVLVSP